MRAAIALALGVAIGCGGGGRGAPDGGGADGGGGDVPATIVCNLPLTTRALTVPRSEVAGVLVGPSRNDSTGCTGDRKTGGPEAMYTLDLAERSLLELEVISNLDTVIAVRRACHDPLSELACNDNPGADVPAVPPDAGPGDAGVAANRDGRLRVVLDPGSYFVLVDEAAAFGVGGDFVLRASVTPPPLQTSCETALPIMDGTVLEAQELDVGPPAQLCAGGGSGRALYYRANIPAGHRLTARAAGRLGLMSWKPTLQVLTACGTGVCAGTPEPGYDVDRVLRFENTGLGPASVVLAVSSNEPVPGGSFRLSARIRQFPTNTTCETAQALSDGLVLRNQYLLEGQSLFGDLCNPPRATPSLFYKAMLVPGQTVRLELHGRTDESPGPLPLLAHVVEQCEALRCPGQGANTVEFKNDTQVRKTVIFEVAGHPALTATVFDLTARMPLPAGGVEVKAVNQVVTTEAGGKASFTVVLATPPIEPVELSLASSDLGEGLVEPTTMTFFPDTWDRPQIVTVTGVDDAFPDGTQSYRLHIGPAASRDSRFQGLVVPEVALINRDDEPGFHVERPPSLLTSERGAATRFTVVMNRAPAAAVRLPLASSDEGEGRVSPAELVFDPATWSIPQSVTVTGVDDADDDGKQRYKVQLAPSISAEPLHAGIDPPDLDVENGDDDFSSVAARLVTGNRFCYAGTSIGVDQFGLLYLVTTCDRQVDVRGDPIALVFTSADGGLSWSDPVEPGLTQGGGDRRCDAEPGGAGRIPRGSRRHVPDRRRGPNLANLGTRAGPGHRAPAGLERLPAGPVPTGRRRHPLDQQRRRPELREADPGREPPERAGLAGPGRPGADGGRRGRTDRVCAQHGQRGQLRQGAAGDQQRLQPSRVRRRTEVAVHFGSTGAVAGGAARRRRGRPAGQRLSVVRAIRHLPVAGRPRRQSGGADPGQLRWRGPDPSPPLRRQRPR
jgi:hypothetical protein